jgi:hypothetical protein
MLQDVYIICQNINQVNVGFCTECCDVFVFVFVFVLHISIINLYICLAKGRTNYELHPENYALRDGVAQTMTLFKPRLVTVHRPTCLYHQQQLAAAAASKQSPVSTPNRVKFSIASFYFIC